MKNRTAAARIIIAALPFAIAELMSESFRLSFFARPAAWLASFFCGTRAPVADENGYALVCFGESILVNSSCTGVNFFAIAFCCVFFVLTKKSETLRSLTLRFAAAASIAYPFAIFANACRIFLAALSWSAASKVLPQNYFAISHMGIGILNFFILLSILIYFLNSYAYARQNN